MSTRFIEKGSSAAELLNLPNAAGVLVIGGMPLMLTDSGYVPLGVTSGGSVFFVDPVSGSNSYDGRTPATAFLTLPAALAAATAGANDLVFLLGDGATTATARLSANLDWNKNATHLIGVSSGTMISGRARIAPTAAIAAFANFFTVSAAGCRFANLAWFHGFDAGGTNAIAMAVAGSRNRFDNCHIAGMGSTDHADADSAGSRSLKITAGENEFNGCTIGLDTVARGAANASVEFAGGAPRNIFRDCLFPFMCSAATPIGIKVAAAAGSDRFQLFQRCLFVNAIKSTSTQMSALATLAANMGGMIVLDNCSTIGMTAIGTDATSNAQIYTTGPAVANVGGGGLVGVVPA